MVARFPNYRLFPSESSWLLASAWLSNGRGRGADQQRQCGLHCGRWLVIYLTTRKPQTTRNRVGKESFRLPSPPHPISHGLRLSNSPLTFPLFPSFYFEPVNLVFWGSKNPLWMPRRVSTHWTTEWHGRVCLEWQPNPIPYTSGINSTICTIRPDWGMVGDNCANSERASCSAYPPYSLVWTISFSRSPTIFLYSFLKKCQIQTSIWVDCE